MTTLLNSVLILLAFSGCSTPTYRETRAPAPIAVDKNVVVLKHRHFEVHYNAQYRLAKYVKYSMNAQRLRGPKIKRKNHFTVDPLLAGLKLEAIDDKAYRGSHYDKGHLAPAADFAFDQTANDDTFVMSNIAPQTPNLNRTSWRLLEEKVRRFACGEGEVTVITGPILEPGLPQLKNGVAIPKQFFKVVIDETPPKKVIAFIMNQTDRGNVTLERIVPVHEVEQKVREDFSSDLEAEALRQPAQVDSWKEEAC